MGLGSPKQATAVEVLRRSSSEATGVISTQVLQEFYVNAIKKLGISPTEAANMVREYRHLDVVSVTPDLVEEAIQISLSQQISFWDALILSAAKWARCSTLITEDLSHGSRLLGIQIVNPFI